MKLWETAGRIGTAIIENRIAPFSVEGGPMAMEELLRKEPDIDGVICATDYATAHFHKILAKYKSVCYCGNENVINVIS